MGCGSGQGAHFIAKRVASNAKIIALDISSENIAMAKALYPHSNIKFIEHDVLSYDIEEKFDLIVLPDVYEHIPLTSRRRLHGTIKNLLNDGGKVILTVPSPAHQEYLRRKGEGLQIIDEDVTLDDLVCMAEEVAAEVTYFVYVSIWNTNDYIHAILERSGAAMKPIPSEDRIPVKGWRKQSMLQHMLMMPWCRILIIRYRGWKIRRTLR
jgi:SAM-dependent methyltransferase